MLDWNPWHCSHQLLKVWNQRELRLPAIGKNVEAHLHDLLSCSCISIKEILSQKVVSLMQNCATVEVPDVLDLHRWRSTRTRQQQRQNPVYDLVAVVKHDGTLSSGHYTAECWSAQTQQWVTCNDSSVTPLSQRSVCCSQAYMLVYRLQG